MKQFYAHITPHNKANVKLKSWISGSGRGFTIVELLVVIVVIAILASISIVSYNGITNRAHEVAVKSDLRQAMTKLSIYRMDNGEFPANFTGSSAITSTNTNFAYSGGGSSFCLTGESKKVSTIVYHIDQDGSLQEGICGAYAATDCFAFDSATGTITSYFTNQGNIPSNPACPQGPVIPSTIGGVAVTRIGDGAYKSKGLTSITIPGTITWIGNESFRDNSLGSVVIPNSVTHIGYSAFEEAGLGSVTLSNSLVSIGDWAFAVNSISSVTIPNSVTTIFNGAFNQNPGIVCNIPAGKSFPDANCTSYTTYTP